MRIKPIADELAEIRTELARLKLREAKLRHAILTAAEPVPPGRQASVEVVHHTTRVFDPALLPDTIRNNPTYWRETETVTIRTLPATPVKITRRPGWPIQRAPLAGALH